VVRRRAVSFVLTALAVPAGVVASCSSGGQTLTGADAHFPPDSTFERAILDGPIRIDASCKVTLDTPPLLPEIHVPVGTPVDYDSNPPCNGPHYPIWAAYQTYSSPVPRPYYVHDLEHGAIVLVYKCDQDDGCPAIVQGLQATSDAIPDDPVCTLQGEGVRVRTVITPDPLLDVPVAAAAWGWVYRADCLDLPSLKSFALAHYAQAPENLCANGTTTF
jgi:hypothetical protein